MSYASSLGSFVIVGVSLAILGVAVLTALYDSWWSQRRQHTTPGATEPAALSKAA